METETEHAAHARAGQRLLVLCLAEKIYVEMIAARWQNRVSWDDGLAKADLALEAADAFYVRARAQGYAP